MRQEAAGGRRARLTVSSVFLEAKAKWLLLLRIIQSNSAREPRSSAQKAQNDRCWRSWVMPRARERAAAVDAEEEEVVVEQRCPGLSKWLRGHSLRHVDIGEGGALVSYFHGKPYARANAQKRPNKPCCNIRKDARQIPIARPVPQVVM